MLYLYLACVIVSYIGAIRWFLWRKPMWEECTCVIPLCILIPLTPILNTVATLGTILSFMEKKK